MGKETKIGLVVIGVLLMVFGLVLWRRLAAADGPETVVAQAEAAAPAKKQPSMAPAKKPAVVTPRPDVSFSPSPSVSTPPSKSRLVEGGLARPHNHDHDDEAGATEPAPSFLPTNDRYGTRAATEADDGRPTASSAGAGDPFRLSRAMPAATDDDVGPGAVEDDAPESTAELVDIRQPSLLSASSRYSSPPADTPSSGGVPATDNELDQPASSGPSESFADRYGSRSRGGTRLAIVPAEDELPDDLPPDADFSWADEKFQGRVETDSETIVDLAPTTPASPPVGWKSRASQPHAAVQTRPAAPSRPSVAPSRSALPSQPFPSDTRSALPRDEREYVVEANDNFWKISQKLFGTGAYFRAIFEHNRGQYADPNAVQEGDVLWVPPAEELVRLYPDLCPQSLVDVESEVQAVVTPVRRRPMPGRTYVVREGETLFDIARYELGKATRWAEIYDLNREALGQDVGQLRPGMRLVLPAGRSTDPVAGRRSVGVR